MLVSRGGNTNSEPAKTHSTPTHAPPIPIKLGHRRLQNMSIARPVCKDGGRVTTCDDGVKNGNEAMADCGGDCTDNQTAQCAADAAAVYIVRSLTSSGIATPRHFDVLLPSAPLNITTHWSRTAAGAVTVRAAQTLVINCVTTAEGCGTCDWPTTFLLSGSDGGPAQLELLGAIIPAL